MSNWKNRSRVRSMTALQALTRALGRAGAHRRLTLMAVALLAWGLAPPPARSAEAVQDFKGKVIRIVVGFPAGGGFDLYARTVAEFLPRFLTGEPRIIVENMPGASTARAAAYVYNVAAQDGTVFGIFHQGLLANQVLGVQAGDFDMIRFNWIGRMGTQLNVGLAWHTSGVRSIEDAKKTELVLAATTQSATSAMVPRALNQMAGTKFKVVTGYQGSTDMYLAMERGEVLGMATGVWFDLTRERADWLKSDKVSMLFQISTKRIPDLPNVPAIPEIAAAEDDRKILHLLASTEDMGRAFATGPKVPSETVAALRAAFAKMMADPEFLRQSARRNFEIAFMHGDELQNFAASTGRFPDELRAKAKQVLMP
jgi:tripartite-type tricarboxylate transporter receptor subunit TctC